MNEMTHTALGQGFIASIVDWAGAFALLASMVYWTVYSALPVDMCWSSTANAASRSGLL